MAVCDEQEPMAIIGTACRFSGDVSSMGSLWDMISKSKTGHCKVPASRWDADLLHHPDPDRKGTMAVQHGYFMTQDVSEFDAPFFQTTAKEAAGMDPMKRLLLEVSYESLENAGISVDSLANTETGCYVGCMTNDYEMLSAHDMQDLAYTAATSNSEAMTANRISWFYGLRGPSLTLDTACSSSLYALHLACQSLKLREANMFLVAGVNLMLYPNTMEQFSAIHMLSPEGISHSFDDRANGYGRGEGIGCLIVKRLSDAIRDGDTIRAVIRNTGTNADGKTPSISAPSSDAQADLIRRTYATAGLDLESTQYFESHGTGTPVGDPIECKAIASTIGAARKMAGLSPLYIGSIKPNVGHTEGCAGMAGLLKAILCLEKGMLVPTFDVQRINPKLALEDWHLALPSSTMKWPSPGHRRISVNSFGFGGANAHVILDDAFSYMKDRGLTGNHNTTVYSDNEGSDSGISTGPSTPPNGNSDIGNSKQLFVFSSRDKAGNGRWAKTFATEFAGSMLDKKNPRLLENLAYTLGSRRSHHDFRTFAIASSLDDLSRQLSQPVPKFKRASKLGQNLVFICTGQGAQWPAMGVELLSQPVFEHSIRASQTYLKEQGCEWDPLEELLKIKGSNIDLPQFSQTLCTVLQIALIDLLRHWNIIPAATVGHSSGEIAAAYAASYISHEDAVRIAYVRGLSSAMITQEGAMLAAGISRAEAKEYLTKVAQGSAVVACINGPSSVTFSGDLDAVDILEKIISADGKFARKLKVKTAYHSHHIREVAQTYLWSMGKVKVLPGGNTVMYSSLTGKIVTPEMLDAQYWVDNMCNPVEFESALTALLDHTESSPESGTSNPIRWGAFIEIGPHVALQGPVQQIISATGNKSAKECPYVSPVIRGKDSNDSALSVAGSLWAVGINVDLSAVNGLSVSLPLSPQRVLAELPSYPWDHSRRFWHEAHSTRWGRFPAAARQDLLGVPDDLQNLHEPRWKNWLRLSENPWIEDHKITGTILYPGAGMLVMALEGALQVSDTSKKVESFRFRNVTFERGLVVTDGDETAVETRLSLLPIKNHKHEFDFTVFSTTDGSTWTKHCYGSIALEVSAPKSQIESLTRDPLWIQQSEKYRELCLEPSAEEVDVDTFYDNLEAIGMQYGPLFRNVTSLTSVSCHQSCHGTVVIPDTQSAMPASFEYPHIIHPATLDAIFHLILGAIDNGTPAKESAVPYSLEELWLAADQPQGPGKTFKGYSNLVAKNQNGRECILDMIVADEAWSAPKIIAKGFAVRQVTSGNSAPGTMGNGSGDLKKCARIVWNEDVDFIRTKEELAKLGNAIGAKPGLLKLWLDRLTHKKLVNGVLIVTGDTSPGLEEMLQDVYARVGQRPGVGQLTLYNPANKEDVTAIEDEFDLVLVLDPEATIEVQSGLLEHLYKVLSENGHLAISSKGDCHAKLQADISSLNFSSVVCAPDSFIAAQKTSASMETKLPTDVYFLLPVKPSDELTTLWSSLAALLTSRGLSIHLCWDLNLSVTKQHVISFLEVDAPLIYSWNEQDFSAFKSLVSTQTHALWITRGSVLDSWTGGVEFAAAQGLLRVMRNEYPVITLPHLDLSSSLDLSQPSSTKMIFDVWRSSMGESAEMEYAEAHGTIHIPRAVSDAGFDGDLQFASGAPRPVKSLVRDGSKPSKLSTVLSDGRFLWSEFEEPFESLQPREVEIEVEFVGLNTSAADPKLACEAVGFVVRCGSLVDKFFSGQRVIVLAPEACNTRIRQDESLVAAMPSNLKPAEAAAIPGAFIAAQYALLEVAGVSSGQSVLVHHASSPLGQAAIQILQKVGATVYALVDSQDDKTSLIALYGLNSDFIFDSNRQTFVSVIEHATQARGVDAILCGRSGPAVLQSLVTLSNSGYFLDLGASPEGSPQIILPYSKRNSSLVHIDFNRLWQAKPQVIKKLFQRTFNGPVAPLYPTALFSVSNASEAVETISQRGSGSVVLSIENEASVWTMPKPIEPLKLDGKATYVLAGGLGALGLDIARMMVDHGAKHLVFLSRSGGNKNEDDLRSFENRQVLAEAFKCDVNDARSVTQVFEKLRSEGRVIKGLVQCAMVLEDGIFENMTHAGWWKAFQPKTRGSRNLLAQLSVADDPFFILLSSITGIIGNTAQANYASGNTFEDALAQNARTHLGISATSIDVGLVNDASHFSSSGMFGDLKSYLTKYQHGWVGLQCTIEELRVSLQAAMRGTTMDGQAIPAQVILGLEEKIVRETDSTGFQRDQKFNLRLTSIAPGAANTDHSQGFNLAEKLSQATSLAEAATAVEEAFKIQIAAAFGIETSDVDSNLPLPDLGVDSLKAVEIRNRVLKEMQSEISIFELLSITPLKNVATKIATKSALVKIEA